MAYGVDSEINERVDMYSSDPQKLAQRYAQSQSLLDLLALQKLKSEKEAAMRNMQGQMQPPMNTVREQREQQVLDMTRNEVAQQAMQGGQQLALNQQREMQARGLPTQAAPNMRGMMGGGIVGYQAGGQVEERGLLEKIGRTFLGDESYDILRKQSESNKANTQMQPPMTESERVTYLQNLMLKRKAAGATDAEIQRIQEEIDSYYVGNLKGSGLKGFEGGGIVGLKPGGTPEDRMRELGIDPDYGVLDVLGAPFQFLGDKFKEGSLAAAEFLGDIMPGGGSVGRERMAEQEFAKAVELAYPDASAGDVRAITTLAMLKGEEPPPPAVDTGRVRAEEYMGSDQQVDDMMADIYRGVEPEAPVPTGDGLAGLAAAMKPSRLEELRKQREDVMGGITSPERLKRDQLRSYLLGLAQTGAGGGAEALTKEQQRQDALRVGDLDRLIELEREDVKLQREIDASMAEVVAKNEAELAQIIAKAGFEEQMNLAGDRRKFIADVIKQVQEDAALNTDLIALEQARREGDISPDAYEAQRLDIFKRAISGLPANYDIEVGLGGNTIFTSGSFE